MEKCVFCKIIRTEIPAKKIFEDDRIMAFLDIYPAALGHSLVITKKHYSDLTEVPEEELGKLISIVQKVSTAITRAIKADGFNIMLNNKKAAGQLIPHIHFHIVPRFEGDGLKLHFPSGKASEEELSELQGKIVENLQ